MKFYKNFIFTVIYIVITLNFVYAQENEPLNYFQCIGSHNSYKVALDTALYNFLYKLDPKIQGVQYTHAPLAEQLDLGLRALEIDVYADTKGGKFSKPNGLNYVKNQAPFDTTGYWEPGFKVLHIQDIDFRSNCRTFKICLQQLKVWSDAHPNHETIFITMNAKDDTIKRPGFSFPEKFTESVLDDLDKAVLAGLSDKVITPDMVRGNEATLETAILKRGWLTKKQGRGKFIFVLDEGDEKTNYYIAHHPSLRGRVFFTNSKPGKPEAAILIMNDVQMQLGVIKKYVQLGYIVRTRSDADTREARTNDYSKFKAAQESGAQIISTDYYYKSSLFKSDFVISFDDKKYYRENPLLKK